MTTTPDIEEDVLQRISSLAGADVDVAGSDRNAWSGPIRPSHESGIPMKAVFVRLTGGGTSLHNDGRLRALEVTVTIRSEPQQYEEARARAHRIYDAVDLSGAFTGSSGKSYYDMLCLSSAPTYEGAADSGEEFFSFVVEVATNG